MFFMVRDRICLHLLKSDSLRQKLFHFFLVQIDLNSLRFWKKQKRKKQIFQ